MSDANYLPSASRWVRDQVSAIERAGDTRAVDMGGKVPLMRVEHQGTYAAIASLGGAPKDPQWAGNLRAHPDVEVQDGRDVTPMLAREVTDPAERAQWWDRAVAAFPDYAAYQQRTTRVIPIFLLEPR